MGRTFWLDELRLDSGLSFDSGANFDTQGDALALDIVTDDEASLFVYIVFTEGEIKVVTSIEADFYYAEPIPMIELVPEKFRQSEVLKDYLREVGILLGKYLHLVKDIPSNLNPETVNLNFAKHLAKIIGYDLWLNNLPENEELKNVRQQLLQAVDLYKIKGTYESLILEAYREKLTARIYDLWTIDYVNFKEMDWFVGERENEIPQELGAGNWYKSPHFKMQVLLDKAYEYEETNYFYLWQENKYKQLRNRIDDLRPAYTVPHYSILLNVSLVADNTMYESYNAKIYAKTYGTWSTTAKLFDNSYDFDDSWKFDEGGFSEYNHINKFVLGRGNKGLTPNTTGVIDVANPVYTGTITDKEVYTDRIEFNVKLDKSIDLRDISEIGLYDDLGNNLRLLCLFPDINKTNLELEVKIVVYMR